MPDNTEQKWTVDIHVFAVTNDTSLGRNKDFYDLRDELKNHGIHSIVLDRVLSTNGYHNARDIAKLARVIFPENDTTYEEFKEKFVIGRADTIVEQFIDYNDLQLENFEHWHPYLQDDEVDAFDFHIQMYDYEGAGTYDCLAHYLEDNHGEHYDEDDLRVDNRNPGGWYQVHEFLARWLQADEYRQLVVQIGNMYFWAVQGSGRSIDDDGILEKIYENWKRGTL